MSERRAAHSWFRGARGRRYGREFAAIVACKIVALFLLWFFCIRPLPHADTAPAAVERHLLAPAPAAEEARRDR